MGLKKIPHVLTGGTVSIEKDGGAEVYDVSLNRLELPTIERDIYEKKIFGVSRPFSYGTFQPLVANFVFQRLDDTLIKLIIPNMTTPAITVTSQISEGTDAIVRTTALKMVFKGIVSRVNPLLVVSEDNNQNMVAYGFTLYCTYYNVTLGKETTSIIDYDTDVPKFTVDGKDLLGGVVQATQG